MNTPKARRRQRIRQARVAKLKEPKPSKVNTETLPENIDPRVIDFLESQNHLADILNQFCIEFRLRFPSQTELNFRAANAMIGIVFDEAEEENIH